MTQWALVGSSGTGQIWVVERIRWGVRLCEFGARGAPDGVSCDYGVFVGCGLLTMKTMDVGMR